MDTLDKKILDTFPGKVVRKDLTSLMKKGANVPTYVLEYLLGMYCATDDDAIIQAGLSKINNILSKNYVRPDQSEFIKSQIREQGSYTIIDKIHVEFIDYEDIYVAYFTNLNISPFEVNSDLVIHNDKLLTGGIWCMIRVDYVGLEKEPDEDDFDVEEVDGKLVRKKKKRKRKSRYLSPFEISSLKPIQLSNVNIDSVIQARSLFTTDEWKDVVLRSVGYEPTELSDRQKMHYLLRMVPFIQKNYNLVELGPRGTGKSHIYSEISPYSILMSSGHTTVANMFYNMGSRRVGLVGNWDCIAFDEVGGIDDTDQTMVQIMKNYMANGSFARGSDSISSDASIAFEGNTFHSVQEMMRITNLFEPFPTGFNNDSAFFDRIHAYLPGWETPKLRNSLFTNQYGFITDFIAEFCHRMRQVDFTNSFANYYALNRNFNTRDEIAVRRTFSGLAKLIYPNDSMTKEECQDLLEYCIELRRRVKEQLRKMNPSEFNDVALGYIDLDTDEEFIVELPEVSEGSLVFNGFEEPGYVYAVGMSIDRKLGVYRLENKLIPGTGKLNFRNVEGIKTGSKTVRDSITAAFNYFETNCRKICRSSYDNYDYSIFYNDLQNRGVSEEVSVAEVVGLFSVLAQQPVKPSTVICGRVVMSGSMMDMNASLFDVFVAASNAGAKNIMLPDICMENYEHLNKELKQEINVIFYTSPLDAAKKALGVE